MNEYEKAKQLVLLHGVDIANKVVDGILDEIQIKWNQERIDYYLDVRREINKMKNS